MADTNRTAFSNENAALFIVREKDCCDGRIAFYGSNRAQPAAGNGPPLVVQEPVSRDARPAPLPLVHGFVRRRAVALKRV